MNLDSDAFLDLKEELAAGLEAGTITRDDAVRRLMEAGWSNALAVEFCRNVVDGEGE